MPPIDGKARVATMATRSDRADIAISVTLAQNGQDVPRSGKSSCQPGRQLTEPPGDLRAGGSDKHSLQAGTQAPCSRWRRFLGEPCQFQSAGAISSLVQLVALHDETKGVHGPEFPGCARIRRTVRLPLCFEDSRHPDPLVRPKDIPLRLPGDAGGMLAIVRQRPPANRDRSEGGGP